MIEKNVATAVAYYQAMGNKDLVSMDKYLDPDVTFISPMGTVTGKEAFLAAAKHHMTLFKSLTIRAQFGNNDQAMVVYDFDIPEPIGIVKTAAFLKFQGSLISRIELFYDARPFEQ